MNPSRYVIVVGVDYSTDSDLALQEAFEFASSKQDVEFHIVNVQFTQARRAAQLAEADFAPPWQNWALVLQEHVALQVNAFQARTGVTPFHRLFTHLRMDDPGHRIAQLAADLDADLVVVGTADRHGVARLLLGSVAQAVMRLAPCPVLVVRPKAIPIPVPVIEPPCPRCVDTRFATHGAELWCEQHRERHGQHHTYHQADRVGGETNFPLVTQG